MRSDVGHRCNAAPHSATPWAPASPAVAPPA